MSEGLNFGSLTKTFIISLVAAFFSYVFLYIYANYVVLYFAYDFDIPAYLDINGVVLLGDKNHDNWSRDALITIFLSKPISAVILGIITLIILMIGSKKPVSIILLLFWLNVFSFNEAFGILIDDAIAGSGTYEVAEVMNFGKIFIISGAVILAFLLYKIGMMNGRIIIMTFQNQNLFPFKSRILFFIFIFFLPWIIILVATFSSVNSVLPNSQLIKNLTVIILLIPFLTSGKIKNKEFVYTPIKRHLISDIVYTFVFGLLTIAMIFVLINGLQIIHI